MVVSNMEDIKLWQGDCLQLMNDIPNKSVDCIITDLPYGQTQRNKWDSVIPFEPLWEQYKRIIKDNGAIILFGNGMFTAELMMSNKITLNMENLSGDEREQLIKLVEN